MTDLPKMPALPQGQFWRVRKQLGGLIVELRREGFFGSRCIEWMPAASVGGIEEVAQYILRRVGAVGEYGRGRQ